jgi:hypothetical protein
MLKIALFLGVVIIGFVAYTGIDVTKEYEAVSNIRDDAFNKVVDPLSKKILSEAANSNLDEILNKAVDGLNKNGGAQ